MKLIKNIVFFNFFIFFFSFLILAEEKGPKKLGKFEYWNVYAKSKNLCYMIAQPINSEGEYTIRGRVRTVVYRNSREKDNKNVLGIDFGYSFPENGKALIEIDKRKSFELSTFAETAWTNSQTKKNKEIINEMIKGSTLIAFGKSKRGTDTKDIYSLKGFSRAFKKIKDYCG